MVQAVTFRWHGMKTDQIIYLNKSKKFNWYTYLVLVGSVIDYVQMNSQQLTCHLHLSFASALYVAAAASGFFLR